MNDDMRQIKVTHIRVKENVRQGELNVAELAADIRAHGLLQPLLVRRCGEGYELVAGHRRLAACKELHMEAVPCLITDGHDLRRIDMQLAENIQHEGLTPYEIGLALRKLRDGVDSIWELARKVHKSYPWVTNYLEYADLYDDLRASGVDEQQLRRMPCETLLEFKAIAPADRPRLVRDLVPADPEQTVPSKLTMRKALEVHRVVPREKRKKPVSFEITQHGLVLALEFRTKLDVRRVVQILLTHGGRQA